MMSNRQIKTYNLIIKLHTGLQDTASKSSKLALCQPNNQEDLTNRMTQYVTEVHQGCTDSEKNYIKGHELNRPVTTTDTPMLAIFICADSGVLIRHQCLANFCHNLSNLE